MTKKTRTRREDTSGFSSSRATGARRNLQPITQAAVATASTSLLSEHDLKPVPTPDQAGDKLCPDQAQPFIITALQAGVSLVKFVFMQAVIRATFGISAPQ
jgi:hypothetical protein